MVMGFDLPCFVFALVPIVIEIAQHWSFLKSYFNFTKSKENSNFTRIVTDGQDIKFYDSPCAIISIQLANSYFKGS